MNTSNIEIDNINYKQYQFVKAKYFGYEILINKEDNYINITKLLNIINEEHRKTNKSIKEFRKLICNEDYKEFEEELKKDLAPENSDKLQIYYKLNEISNEFKGTYIHQDLINYVLMWADKKYAIKIGRILKELNNDNINKVNELVEELRNENDKLKNQIVNDKSKIIPVKTNELKTNVKIKIYKDISNNESYKISYNQKRNLESSTYKLIKEIHTNSASNIVKSDGLKQYYIDNKTRVFKSNDLNDVIDYLTNQN